MKLAVIWGSFAGVILAIAAAWAFHGFLLRQAARLWIVSDPISHADAIVVLGGGRAIRPAAAAELFQRGVAREILVPKSNYDQGQEADATNSILVGRGVPADAIVEFPIVQHSTYGEARGILEIARTRGIKRLVIPTDIFPTRRTRWIFERELASSGVRINVLAIRAPDYGDEDWWVHGRGSSAFLSEIVKYLYYRAAY
jgi:uncharacterized SAM-binding protein YcdF (DUF218 family)